MAPISPRAARILAIIRREWKDLVTGIVVDETLATRFSEIDAQLTAREVQAREADARARREALARLQQLLGRVEPLAAEPDVSLKAAERALRDVRAALGAMPQLPSKQDYDERCARLKAAQTALTPKVQELREVDDWQRWANVGIQEQLCAKMEALKAVEDPEAIAREVRELQQQWRQAADVPRAQGEALWRRFKAAHDEVWPRCEAHFAAQAEERRRRTSRRRSRCASAPRRSPTRPTGSRPPTRSRSCRPSGRRSAPVSRGQREGDLGAVPRRLRSVLHPPPRRSRRAQGGLGREPGEEGSAVREGRGARRIDRLGCRPPPRSGSCRPSGRRSARSRRAGPRRSGSASAAPATLLRALRAAPRHRPRRAGRRARGDLRRARSASRSDLRRRAAAVERRIASRRTPAQTRGASGAGDDEASAGQEPLDLPPRPLAARRWQQEIAARGVDPDRAARARRRFAAAFTRVHGPLAGGLRRHRSRSRRQPQADGSAGRGASRSSPRRSAGPPRPADDAACRRRRGWRRC